MDQQVYELGKSAYQAGNWAEAITALSAAIEGEEPAGSAEHLIGNCLMKLGRFSEAAEAYGRALKDASYGNAGALLCNQGRAYLAAGDNERAARSLSRAAEDPDYPTPYKAYMALGNAQVKLGDIRSAGVAYRSAAIDESTPDPALALTKLGSCFMELGRPVDAVEAFRTALDFSSPAENQAAIYAELGGAYVASNKMNEAVDAFSNAEAEGFEFKPEQRASYDAAKRAVSAISARTPSATDDLLAAAGYGSSPSGSYDPLDPLGKSGEFMPSPEDTGFFTISEQEIVEADRITRKHKGGGLKVFIFFLILALLLAGAAGFAYYKGFGWPTQQAVCEGMFSARGSDDFATYLSEEVSEAGRNEMEAIIPVGATAEVLGVDMDMTQSKVLVEAHLAEGGTQQYIVYMVRDGISWKVTAVELAYDSEMGTGISPTETQTGTISAGSEG
ncbi:MAG: tetratricopeptide repeat protein [Atopobiaceae bacterium]|nr:tetratricopeptide repeat protein [Atopobiaceae bacterium]